MDGSENSQNRWIKKVPIPEKTETRHIRQLRCTDIKHFAWRIHLRCLFLTSIAFFFLLGLKKCRVGLFISAQIQRNLLQLSVFRHSGWSSTIPKALGRAVISWLSEHNGWKLSYYLSVLSKGKGSCGAERPRKSLVLILLKGVGQPSQILFS